MEAQACQPLTPAQLRERLTGAAIASAALSSSERSRGEGAGMGRMLAPAAARRRSSPHESPALDQFPDPDASCTIWPVPRPKNKNRSPAASPSPAKSPAPSAPAFIPPMAAQLATALPEGPEWLYEVKWDGYRALLIKRRAGQIRSRNDKDLTASYPRIPAAAQSSAPAP